MIHDFKPDLIMNLAAILSASGEKVPELCYSINVNGFKNVCDQAVANNIPL
jgi:nucleoside-diphosphate-sugar epimerase